MTDQAQTTLADTPETRKRQMSFHVAENGDVIASFEGDGIDPIVLSLDSVPESIKIAAITEGLISRARSYCGKVETRTPENLRVAVAQAFANLQSGIWKIERESTGITVYPIEVVAAFEFRKGKALAAGKEFTDTLESVAALWDGLTDEQKAQVKALPRYKAAYAAEKAARAVAKAEKLAKKADADEQDAPM
jgi:hypothetical protein